MSFGFGASDRDIKDVPLAALDTMLVDHDLGTLRLFRHHTMERLVHALDDLALIRQKDHARMAFAMARKWLATAGESPRCRVVFPAGLSKTAARPRSL